MNYIQHLNKVFGLFYDDERLNPVHISLYVALFQYWNLNRFRNPVIIQRGEVMRIAKIGSFNTYVRTLKDLHEWKYLEYQPSYNPHKGSLVNLYTFDTGSDNSHDTGGVQLPIQQMIPLININKLKEKQIKEGSIKPALNEVMEYFKTENFPETEALKFFNYFESNGWKVGGKTPMKNWRAAARNWMLNAQKFNSAKNENHKSGNLNTGNSKNYGEPL